MFNLNKRLLILVFIMIASLSMTACSDGAQTERRESDAVDRQQGHYQTTQPIPFFAFSQVRDSLIQIYTQLVRATSTYTIIQAPGNGQLIFQCPSYGFPIPADTQLTNPVQVDDWNDVVIEQAEPSGIFTSKNTDGTYVQCVRQNGDIGVVYTEQKVTAFGFGVICNQDGYCVDDQSSPTTLQVILSGSGNSTTNPVVNPTPGQ